LLAGRIGETGWRRRRRGNTSNENRHRGRSEPPRERHGARPESYADGQPRELDPLREQRNALERLRRHRKARQPEEDEREIRDEHPPKRQRCGRNRGATWAGCEERGEGQLDGRADGEERAQERLLSHVFRG
jgi:hypothetical protein